MYCGVVSDGDTLITMFGDFADLWERAAADRTPMRAIVGDDPVEFAEAFSQAYTGKQWIDKERARLTKAIEKRSGRSTNDHPTSHPSARHREVVQGRSCAAWRRLRRDIGKHLRAPRVQRRRQDHTRAHPVDVAEG